MPECLGDGVYSARFVRRRTTTGRAGAFAEGQLPQLISGSWSRKFGQSTASATLSVTPECCGVLAELVDLAVIEVEFWRQGGRQDLVWAGPVKDLIDNRDSTVTINAADSSLYVLDERVVRPGSWVQVDLATVFVDVLTAALAPDDPGLVISSTPTGVLGDRVVADTDIVLVRSLIDELTKTAVDWTVVGREWRIGGTEVDLSRVLPVKLRDGDFGTPPPIRVSRSAMGTKFFVRGSGVVGEFGGPRADGVLIERVSEGNQIIDKASADAAARSSWEVASTPYVVIDGSAVATIAPMTMVDIQTLVPGMLVPVEVGECLPYHGTMRLAEVNVSFSAESEGVALTLQPVGTLANAQVGGSGGGVVPL